MEKERDIKFKGIIFDLDGTLLYTIEDITNALNYALEKNNLPTNSIEEVKYLVGSGAKKLIHNTLQHTGIEFSTERYNQLFDCLYCDYMDRYGKTSGITTKPYNGVIRMLNGLKRRGIKLGVLSNKPQRDTEAVIKKYIPNTFDVVFGGREGIPLKPEPNALYEAINLLGLEKDEVMYVGDSDVDVKTAMNAGVYGLFVCYGYRTKKELIEIGATNFANTPNDILNYFFKPINGVLLLDKPKGMTSQDALIYVKRKLDIEHIGHAGTLDPLATGLLVVLLGEATKLSNYLLEEKKQYICEITIGKSTPTWDLESEPNEFKDVNPNDVTESDIDDALSSLNGKLELTVPNHCAIKVDGKKLYEIARSGKQMKAPTRINTIYEMKRISDVVYFDKSLKFKFQCTVSKGTYIRSLCNKIGQVLNYPALMSDLRRVKSGLMDVSYANTLSDIDNKNFKVISMIDSLKNEKIVEVRDTLIHRINTGREIYLPEHENRIFISYKNELKAIYKKDNKGIYKAVRVWN